MAQDFTCAISFCPGLTSLDPEFSYANFQLIASCVQHGVKGGCHRGKGRRPNTRTLSGTGPSPRGQWQTCGERVACLFRPTHSGYGNRADQVVGQTGAFALPAASKDAALVASLSPGNYSVVVAPANGTAGGTALLEVYDVPERVGFAKVH